jgi:hypothetical protein
MQIVIINDPYLYLFVWLSDKVSNIQSVWITTEKPEVSPKFWTLKSIFFFIKREYDRKCEKIFFHSINSYFLKMNYYLNWILICITFPFILRRILIEVANKWLQHNFDWEVVNCESVTLLFRHNACSHVSQWDLIPNAAATQVMGQEAAIKALRFESIFIFMLLILNGLNFPKVVSLVGLRNLETWVFLKMFKLSIFSCDWVILFCFA